MADSKTTYTSGDAVRRSGLWAFVQRIGTQVISFVLGVFLTRALLPEDFGLMAMVVVFSGFARVLQDFGFGTALIQYKKPTPEHYSSVFWFNMTMGAVLAAILALCAPLLVRFYDQPDLLWVVRFMALEFVLSALVSVQSVRLKKTFRFKLVSLVDLAASILYYAIALPLAWTDWGVWALVGGTLARLVVRTAGLWVFAGWVPRLVLQTDRLRELFRFGSFATGNSLLGYLTRNTDNLLIGRMAGDAALGAYNKAYMMMMLPLQNVVNAIREVMMPAMSEAQDDDERLRMMYLRTIGLIAFVVFPIMAGISVVAEPLIIGLYGEAWRSTVPLLEVLAVVGALQSIISFGGTVYFAKGRPDIPFRLRLVTAPLVLGIFFVGIKAFGVQGMVYMYVGFSLLRFLVDAILLRSVIGLRIRSVWQTTIPPAILSTVMYLVVRGVRALPWEDAVHELVSLVVCAAIGAVVYAGGAILFRFKANREIVRFAPGLTKIPIIGRYLRHDE